MSEESPETLDQEENEEAISETSEQAPIAVDENAARIAALEQTINRQNEMLSRLAQSIPAATQQIHEESAYDNIKDDELVEGIHVKQLRRQTAELQKKLEEMEEATVQARFNDLNQIVTPENLAQLKQKHPTIFQSLGVGDTRTKLTNAYLHIKNYVLSEQTKKQPQIKRQPIPQARTSIADMDGANRSPDEYVPFDGELTPEQIEIIRRRKDEQIARYRKKLANIG